MDDVHNRWLLNLPADGTPTDLARETGGIYFHMWRTRQEPWTSLREGDTVYLVERASRRIIWEHRARHVRRTQYHSMDEAFRTIRESFGFFPEDLTDYVLDRPTDGFFLGWAVEVVSALDVPVPPEVNFSQLGARHGYLPWSRLPASAARKLDLPPPGRPAIAEPAVWMVGDSVLGSPAGPMGRYIPVAVRAAVWERDSGGCQVCGTADPPMHFDHIWPVVRGGDNDLGNIQVLCRRHNLEKAARIVTGAQRPAVADLIVDIAAELGIAEPRLDLIRFVRAAFAVGREADAADALLQELGVVSNLSEWRAALDVLPLDSFDAAFLRAHLAVVLAPDEPAAAVELTAGLIVHEDVDVRGIASLAFAEASPDLPVDERRRLYVAATTTADPLISGWGHVNLARLEEAGDPSLAAHHWKQAAQSSSPSPRSIAAYVLGMGAEDDDEAAGWFRRALITTDPELFAECALELAHLTGGPRACAYARRALEAESQVVRTAAHLYLGVMNCDDDARRHLEEAAKSPDASARDQAVAAIASLDGRN